MNIKGEIAQYRDTINEMSQKKVKKKRNSVKFENTERSLSDLQVNNLVNLKSTYGQNSNAKKSPDKKTTISLTSGNSISMAKKHHRR